MEDSSKASFAGLYESKLWVKPEEVSEALNQVMQSANPAKIEAYLTALKEPGGANKMHAIVQKMIHGAISGVGFSRHPFDSSDVLIEFTKWACNQIVDGSVTPHQLGKQYKKGGALSQTHHEKLVSVLHRLEQQFSAPVDLEWTIDRSWEIHLLQARPITSDIDSIPFWNQIEESQDCIQGHPASPGNFEGTIVLISSGDDLQNINSKSILVAQETSPDYFLAMIKAGGIVTAKGGALCHAAVTCREIKKPCIVWIEDQIKTLQNGDRVKIDGSTWKLLIIKNVL